MRSGFAAVCGALLLIAGCTVPEPASPRSHQGTSPPPVMEPVDAAGDAGRAALPPVQTDPVTSAEEALARIPPAALEGRTFDALLVEDYGHRSPDRQWHERECSTWIVQILHPSSGVTFLIDAATGELNAFVQSEAQAPAKLPKSAQDAVDLVFEQWGHLPYIRQFPSAIGSSESPFRLPDESEIDRFSALSTTAATADRRGEYLVTPPRTGRKTAAKDRPGGSSPCIPPVSSRRPP